MRRTNRYNLISSYSRYQIQEKGVFPYCCTNSVSHKICCWFDREQYFRWRRFSEKLFCVYSNISCLGEFHLLDGTLDLYFLVPQNKYELANPLCRSQAGVGTLRSANKQIIRLLGELGFKSDLKKFGRIWKYRRQKPSTNIKKHGLGDSWAIEENV